MLSWRRCLLTIVGPLIVVSSGWCDIPRFDVKPDLVDAPDFEILIQYVEVSGHLSFDVCADTLGVVGQLELVLSLADADGALGSARVVSTPSELGCAWSFSMRKDLLDHSTFRLIDDQTSLNGHNLPAGRYWKFHLGALAKESFHVESGFSCPRRRLQAPHFEQLEVHMLHLRDGSRVVPLVE